MEQRLLMFIKRNKLLFGIILSGLFLRLYNISESMQFIGDQGWFYLSARDMLLTGNIPLIGIASSHPWLHQGPLWTYMLALALALGRFDPLSGVVLSAILDSLSILLVYKIGVNFFSKRIGILTSLVYAVSPAVVMNARMPYHTSPIPLFVLLLIFSLLNWVIGKKPKFFLLTLFSMSMLYNLELATVVFWPLISGLFIYGLFLKKKWVINLFERRFILLPFLALFAPMIPVVIYDLNHGFPQTAGYAAWFIYKPLQFLGLFPRAADQNTFYSIGTFFLDFYSNLIFKPSILVSTAILILSICVVVYLAKNKINSAASIILATSLISIFGFFVAKTPSYAYLPMLFPSLIFIFAIAVERLFKKYKAIPVLLLVLFSFFNAQYVVGTAQSEKDLLERKRISREILKLANGREYNLIGKGPGSKFESFTMNYEYLTWYLGNPPSKSEQKLKIIIDEGRVPVRVSVYK